MRGRLGAALAASVLVLVGCGGSGGSGGNGPIRIGQIASLTGNYAPLGTNSRLGAAQAAKEINDAGGLLGGRKVEIVVKDDHTQPDQSVVAFNDLAGQSVAAVIGSPFSNSALATIPLVERRKIPYLSTSATDQQIDPVRPYVFMAPATAKAVAQRLLQYFQATGLTRVAVAYDAKSAYAVTGWTHMKDMAGQYGLDVVASERFETTTTNFDPVFTHLRDSGAQALMVWATGTPAVLFTKQFASSGLSMKLVFGHGEASPLYTRPAGAAAEGVIVASSLGVIAPDLPNSEVKDAALRMARPFEQANGMYPPQFAFDGYAAVKLLAAAITTAHSADPAKIQRALQHVTLLTPSGEYHYTPTDHSGLTAADLSVNEVRSGAFVPTEWASQQLRDSLE